jgi:hypothetical protein
MALREHDISILFPGKLIVAGLDGDKHGLPEGTAGDEPLDGARRQALRRVAAGIEYPAWGAPFARTEGQQAIAGLPLSPVGVVAHP